MMRRPPRSPLFPYTTLSRSHRAGKIDEKGIEEVEGNLATTAGTCAVMGTASTMASIAEALGMALPGSAAIEAMVDAVDRKSTRLNSSHGYISYAVFCLKKKE